MRDSAANIRAELKKRGVKAEGYDLDEGKNPETPTTTAVKETNEYMSLEHQIKHVMSNNR